MVSNLVTAPIVELLTAAEVRAHLRISHTSEDAYLDTLVVVARRYAESITWRAFNTQTWDVWFQAWPPSVFKLPYAPLQSVTGVYHTGSDGVENTLPTDYYDVDSNSEPGLVALGYGDSWPVTTLSAVNPIRIRIVAGYGDAASDVPQDLRHAMLLHIGHLYESREVVVVGMTINVMPMGYDTLLAPLRMWEFR